MYDGDDNEYAVDPEEDVVIFNGSVSIVMSSSNGRRIALIATFLRDE